MEGVLGNREVSASNCASPPKRRPLCGRSAPLSPRGHQPVIALSATLCQTPQRTYTDEPDSSTVHPPNRRRRAGDRGTRHARRGRRARDERDRPPDGMTPSTVSRQLGTLAASGLASESRPRAGTGSGSGSCTSRTHSSHGSTCAQWHDLISRSSSRQTGETATLSVPGEQDAITVDYVSGAHYVNRSRTSAGPSVAHATSAGKVMLAFSGRELPAGPLRRLRAADDHGSQEARCRDRSRPGAGVGASRRGARARAVGDRRADLLEPRQSSRHRSTQGPTSRASTRPPIARLCRSCSIGAEAISRELGWRAD